MVNRLIKGIMASGRPARHEQYRHRGRRSSGRIAVKTYLTADEKAQIERAAERAALSLSAFLRVAVLEHAAHINQEGENDKSA